MIISTQKRKENIAEYILYMWQTEDQIRAFGLNLEKIRKTIVAQYNVDEVTKNQILEWYENLISMMETERIQKKGHLQIIQNIVIDLYDLHLRLLKMPQEIKYHEVFFRAVPHIQNLEAKMQDKTLNDVDTCLHALYGVLLLKISGKTISKETEYAIKDLSKFIAFLSKKYNERREEPDKFI